jgi:hypothetical protein
MVEKFNALARFSRYLPTENRTSGVELGSYHCRHVPIACTTLLAGFFVRLLDSLAMVWMSEHALRCLPGHPNTAHPHCAHFGNSGRAFSHGVATMGIDSKDKLSINLSVGCSDPSYILGWSRKCDSRIFYNLLLYKSVVGPF